MPGTGPMFLNMSTPTTMSEKNGPEPFKAARRLGVVFFPAFDWAVSPVHPEREERLLYTGDQLREEGLFDMPGITEYRPELAAAAHIERAHFCLPDVESVCTASHLAAAGAAIRAGRLVMEGRADRAFALARPPGHHAMRVTHGNRGFCNINMEAVMIEHLRDHYRRSDGGVLRVAVVDADCHHGDGTQDIYWNDPDTLFISLHQDGRTLYPGSGFPHECGGPAALGRTINIPLPPGTSDEGYLHVMDNAVLPLLERFKPDLVVNSAGQDSHFTDPLTDMRLSAQGYAEMTRRLAPHVAVLEGGYAVRGALPYVNLAICLALAGLPFEDVREPDWTADAARGRPETMEYIRRACEQVVDIYDDPPDVPTEGKEENGFWTRHREILYDTDMLRETQYEAYRLCPDCEGFLRVETASRRTRRALCLRIPRGACPRCRDAGYAMAETARRAGDHAHVRLMDMTSQAAG